MCNRYASDIRRAGLEREFYGFEEWSETRINIVLGVFPKSIGPVIVKRADGALGWRKMRWGLPGPASTGGAPVTNIRNLQSPHWAMCLDLLTAALGRSPHSANTKMPRQTARKSSAGLHRLIAGC